MSAHWWETDEVWLLSHGVIKATHKLDIKTMRCEYCNLTLEQMKDRRIVLCREAPKEDAE